MQHNSHLMENKGDYDQGNILKDEEGREELNCSMSDIKNLVGHNLRITVSPFIVMLLQVSLLSVQ